MPPKRKAKAIASTAATTRKSRAKSDTPAAAATIVLSDDDVDDDDKYSIVLKSDDDVDEPIVSKRPAKKPRKTPAKPRGGGGGGRAGGSAAAGKFKKAPTTVEQELLQQNEKSKKFVQEFRGVVEAGKEQGLSVLGGMRGGLDKTAPASAVPVPSQKQAADSDKLKAAPVSINKEENPLYQQTQRMLKLCRSMVNRHRAVEAETERLDLKTPREAWEEDKEEMNKLLVGGRQYGERLVGKLISPDGWDSAKDYQGDEVGDMATGLFKRSGEVAERKTEAWGRVANAQLQALTRVVRTLGGFEDEEE